MKHKQTMVKHSDHKHSIRFNPKADDPKPMLSSVYVSRDYVGSDVKEITVEIETPVA